VKLIILLLIGVLSIISVNSAYASHLDEQSGFDADKFTYSSTDTEMIVEGFVINMHSYNIEIEYVDPDVHDSRVPIMSRGLDYPLFDENLHEFSVTIPLSDIREKCTGGEFVLTFYEHEFFVTIDSAPGERDDICNFGSFANDLKPHDMRGVNTPIEVEDDSSNSSNPEMKLHSPGIFDGTTPIPNSDITMLVDYSIGATVQNVGSENVDFVFHMESDNGLEKIEAWHDNLVLKPNQEHTPGFGWTPKISGEHTITFNIWNDIEEKKELAPPVTLQVNVKEPKPLTDIQKIACDYGEKTTSSVEFLEQIQTLINEEKLNIKNYHEGMDTKNYDPTKPLPNTTRSIAFSLCTNVISYDDFENTLSYLVIEGYLSLEKTPSEPSLSITNPRIFDPTLDIATEIFASDNGKYEIAYNVAADVKNIGTSDSDFTFYVKISDGKNEPIFPSISGTIQPNQEFTPAVTWIARNTGTHTLTFGIWDNLINQNDIAIPLNIQVEVISEHTTVVSGIEIASFVDETKDPQSYVDRYNNEESYRKWFSENYPQYDSIYQAVGLPEPVKEKVPSWIKNNAKWWSEGNIDDDTFVGGIQHLMKEKIVDIPDLPEQASEKARPNFVDETKDPQSYVDRYNNEPDYKDWFDSNYPDYTIEEAVGITKPIPGWIKNTASWWSEGLISEDEFIKGIEFLVENRILNVN